LVGVSKTHSPAVVHEAVAAGLRHFGENRVEELLPKRQIVEALLKSESAPDCLPGGHAVVWHMIGHVQSRKAETAAVASDMIHSLDSIRLGKRLDRFAGQAGKVLPVLIEVNLSGEESKYGWPAERWQDDATQWSETCQLVEEIATGCPNLSLLGLMTMAPWVADETVVRPVFRSARRLIEQLARTFPAIPWKHLSMGMTDDFEIAIEEGATLVRVGRAIFGERGPALTS
jgi:hypothetical protein